MSLPGANPPLVHPGPLAMRRRDIVPTGAHRFDIAMQPGDVVESALRKGFANAGFAAGCVLIEGLDCDPLRYVIPAPPIDARRVAWYSGTHAPAGRCRIARAYLSVGRDGGNFMTHCHGLWHLPDGARAFGHLLAPDTVCAAPCRLRAIGFDDALFDRLADAETGFSLFSAVPVAGRAAAGMPGAVAVTLHPNEDISLAVQDICAGLGITRADVLGLGSMNGADFQDGRRMDAAITEFAITQGRYDADTGARIAVMAVDKDAVIYAGALVPGRATVSITAELVIVPD